MKKVLKITGICLIGFVILLVVAFAIYYYYNMHWYDKYEAALEKIGAKEQKVTLPNGNVINYGEVANDKPALLLIHGQMGEWECYALTLEKLSENWHVYAVDVYGHGQSSHDESLYYIDVNGDDLIWFIDNVIGEPTVVSGHSNGALTAAYIGAYGGKNVSGVVMEDPPVFSTEEGQWEESFAYINTYKPLHEYNMSEKTECYEAYSLRHGYFGDKYGGIPDLAEKYHKAHPGEVVKIGVLPSIAWNVNQYIPDYDLTYGEHFYDLSWNHGYTHKQILSDIHVPCVIIHEKENVDANGLYLCATSDNNAKEAARLLGDNGRLEEVESSYHMFHSNHVDEFVDIINGVLD